MSLTANTPVANTFKSLWMAGYEGADHINGAGHALSMNDANQHSQRAYEDYVLLSEFGIKTVRESIGWRLVEQDGIFDFSCLDARAKAAQALGIQINWTLCHYGWPKDIDPYSPAFIERFSRYCRHAVSYLDQFSPAKSSSVDASQPVPVYSPINELSFTCWAAAANRHACSQAKDDGGAELKRQLVRATIRACDEIWGIQPHARILQCDPLIHVGAPSGWPGLEESAARYNQAQYEAWDMLCGMQEPELGGAPKYLDIIGVNYYHDNQWGIGADFWWHLGDARRIPLHHMLLKLHERYQRPIVIAETSHIGSGRGAWIKEIAQQAILATQKGVPVEGICLYPVIDRHDWDNPMHWHRSGLWDIVGNEAETKSTNDACKTSSPNRPQPAVIEPYVAIGPNTFDSHASQLKSNLLHDKPQADKLQTGPAQPDKFQRVIYPSYASALHNAQRLTARFIHHPETPDASAATIKPIFLPLKSVTAAAHNTASQVNHSLQQGSALQHRYLVPLSMKGNCMPTIFVFSHLRWDFVFQRPQHLLSRLAEYHRILFIEEPVFDDREPHFVMTTPVPNLTVYTPHVPVQAHGFHDDHLPYLNVLVGKLVDQYDNYMAWFYTPMALPLLQKMNPSLVIYDCMDELSAFANPPKQLLQRENALLSIADIVFTGGPSLYQAKRERHPNVYCFPSSVDVIHFQQALDPLIETLPQQHIASPRLGFYGVIDERFDAELIRYMADTHPEWQIVLVGPIVKIDPAILPQRPNLHYLGQQPYQALPQYLAGWDVCLLPFALNESTKFISPTKTLEYMAAELPIVSTPITDVVNLYSDVVSIAASHESFVAACELLLDETEREKKVRIEKMREIVAQTSWESTAFAMHEIILKAQNQQESTMQSLAMKPMQDKSTMNQAAASANTSAKPAPASAKSQAYTAIANASSNVIRTQIPAQTVRNLIIGAGPTGLSAAYHLGKDTVLLDKNSKVGGWCRSIEENGFTFDYAGHIMFSNDDYVLQLYKVLLGDNIHWQNREAWVYSKGVHTRYPFQGALYGLPSDVIKECIVGAIEARFGPLNATAKPATGKVDIARTEASTIGGKDCKDIADCCADGTVNIPVKAKTESSVSGIGNTMAPPANFEEFIYKVWGRGIAKHFAIPYNKKIWTIPLTEMETSWLGGRVPLPNIEEIIDGALQPVGKPMGPNARFGYPLRGGFQAIMDGFLPHIKGKLELEADVTHISPKQRTVSLADGRRYRYENLISTMPLPQLVRMIGDEAPQAVIDAAKGLKHISIRCVNLGVARENITDKHWIYYPEDSIFHRIFVQGNASPNCNPPGGFGLTCEISYSPWKPLPYSGEQLIERCFQDCINVGLLTPQDRLITANEVDMPYAYVVYDHERAQNVALVKNWLAGFGITLAGRYSEWEYYNSDHAFLAGKKAAETVQWTAQHEEVPIA